MVAVGLSDDYGPSVFLPLSAFFRVSSPFGSLPNGAKKGVVNTLEKPADIRLS